MKWIIENKHILQKISYNVNDATALSDFLWIDSKIKTVNYHMSRKTPPEIFLTPIKSLQPSESLKSNLLNLYESIYVTGNTSSS